jgi:hypothetical protein
VTGLGALLGHGTPAEQARIRHDLNVIRLHGLAHLRHLLDGHPVPADLYLAALARIDHRAALRDHWASEDHARHEATQEQRDTARGGNR